VRRFVLAAILSRKKWIRSSVFIGKREFSRFSLINGEATSSPTAEQHLALVNKLFKRDGDDLVLV
jgi:hypothetical protein